MQPNRPNLRYRSVKELAKNAVISIDDSISCKLYLNSAINLFNQV